MARRIGNSPACADAMLAAALQGLRGRAGTAELLDRRLFACAESLARYLPSHYLADVYLDQPLVGCGSPRAALVLDATERNHLNHLSEGSYLEAAGIPPALGAGDFDLVCGLVAGDGVRPFCLSDDSLDARDLADGGVWESLRARLGVRPGDEEGPEAFLAKVGEAGIAARVLVRGEGGGAEVVVVPIKVDPRATFDRAPYRDAVRRLLGDLGCEMRRVDAFDSLHATCGVRGYSVADGLTERVVLVDVAYVKVRWEKGELVGASVGVLISDRIPSASGEARKPGVAYQWHITDDCDQRCKHCYLFAEDARRRCVSTPWDQLLHTLDEVERSAARRGGVAEIAISGGDPILHPRFWDLAAELRARGIRWSAMGNPFHLDGAVCRRLRSLGCYQYQMSLDGLEPFHDYLRKPGSYAATLAALGPLGAAGIQTQLMATASKKNLGDILVCMDVAAEHGATSFAFARYCATSRAKAAELYPTAQEYRAFLLAYHQKKQEFEAAGCRTRFKEKDHLFTLLRWELGEFKVPTRAVENPASVYAGCHLGAKCAIAANGDLLACRRMESVVGNIRDAGLWEMDRSEAMAAYADPSHIAKCADCVLLSWCRGCRAVGVNATGDLQAADPMCWHEPNRNSQIP